MKKTMPIRAAIMDLSEALDPQHQGECWPDPIRWDGRPLREQARDLLALADAEVRQYADAGEDQIAQAARALRVALSAPRTRVATILRSDSRTARVSVSIRPATVPELSRRDLGGPGYVLVAGRDVMVDEGYVYPTIEAARQAIAVYFRGPVWDLRWIDEEASRAASVLRARLPGMVARY